jgi:hypothetical protein
MRENREIPAKLLKIYENWEQGEDNNQLSRATP